MGGMHLNKSRTAAGLGQDCTSRTRTEPTALNHEERQSGTSPRSVYKHCDCQQLWHKETYLKNSHLQCCQALEARTSIAFPTSIWAAWSTDCNSRWEAINASRWHIYRHLKHTQATHILKPTAQPPGKQW